MKKQYGLRVKDDRLAHIMPVRRITYFLYNSSTRRIKIGQTVNLRARMQALRTAGGVNLELIGAFDGDHEQKLHERFSDCRAIGEWFNLSVRLAEFLYKEFGVRTLAFAIGATPTDRERRRQLRRARKRAS